MVLPKVVIFDWDETIANTRSAVVFAVENVLKKYNKESWQETKKKRDHNLSFKDNFYNFFGNNYNQAYQDYVDFYKEAGFSKISLKDGCLEFIKYLKNNNVALYIVSNKDKNLLKKEVIQLFKYNVFEEIIGEAKKPNKKSVYLVLKNVSFEINEENVWFVGDSTQDYDCAIACGIKPIIIGNNKFFDGVDVLKFENFDDFLERLKNADI